MVQSFPELNFTKEFYFQWHITEKCNLRCRHCYHENYSSDNELQTEELLDIAEQINNAVTKWGKLASLSLTGGEPLLRIDALQQIMSLLDSKDGIYYYDLLTNGTLLDEEIISVLKRKTKLRRIQLSLEGANPEKNDEIRGKNSFNRIIAAIKLLKQTNIPVSIMVTLTKRNFDDISSFINLAIEYGIDYLSFERFIPEGSGKNIREQLLTKEQIKQSFETIAYYARTETKVKVLTYRPLFALCGDDGNLGAMCSVGTNALTIMQDGTVYPCRRLPIPIGNILEDGLFKIWYDSPVLWDIRNSRNLQEKCRSCDLITNCRGCRAMAYFISGNYLAEDPQCWKT